MMTEEELIKELDRMNDRIKALSKKMEQKNNELRNIKTTEEYIEFVKRWYGKDLKENE